MAPRKRPSGDGVQVVDRDAPIFVISVAAQLAGMHPQTLRTYDRMGLVSPRRTSGRGRRYSPRDVAKLRLIQRLSQDEGINLQGIRRILELEDHVTALQARLAELADEVERLRAATGYGQRVFAAGRRGDVVAMPPGQRPHVARGSGQALVVWRPTTPG